MQQPAIPPGATYVPSEDGKALVIREEPLLIRVGEQSVLTMRTPGDDADLALGFLLGEGILLEPEHATRIELLPKADAEDAAIDCVRVHLAPGYDPGPVARERLTRAHAIRPSCGLCGLVSAEGLTRHLRPLQSASPRIDLAALSDFATRMRSEQRLFALTGGCHAAAVFCAGTGELWALREDVGRHNALDKAFGRCAADSRDMSHAIVVLSGRGGYELVLKALRVGAPVVASISAPTSLAVELAEEHGQTLIGFLRDGTGRVYTDDGRVAS